MTVIDSGTPNLGAKHLSQKGAEIYVECWLGNGFMHWDWDLMPAKEYKIRMGF